jgi:AhpD family alkylhydroperoxidase
MATVFPGTVTRCSSEVQGSAVVWNQLTSVGDLVDHTLAQCCALVSPGITKEDTYLGGRLGLNLRNSQARGRFAPIGLQGYSAMSRIDLLNGLTAPLPVRNYFDGNDPGPIVAALANVPELVGPTLGFLGAALGDGAASTRHKEFAILRTSALQGCQYCIHAHTGVALDAGLTDTEVRSLRGEVPIEEAFPEDREQRLIRWIDAMSGSTGPISADVWEPVRKHFADHILVELSTTIGATLFLNRFATGFELPSSQQTLDRLESAGML